MLRNAFYAAAPRTEQRDNEFAYLGGHVLVTIRAIGIEQLPRELREFRIPVRIRQFEVTPGADDSVEVVTELYVSAEDPLVHGTIRGGVVSEADAARPPIDAEERSQHPKSHSDGELGCLTNAS